MLRTVYWGSVFALSTIVKTPSMISMKSKKEKMDPMDFDILAEKVTSKWAKLQIKTTGSKSIIKGLENIPKDEAVLFVSNHQSNFDIAFFMAEVRKPKGFVSKIELSKIPFIHIWMEYINCIFMDRDDIKQSAKTIFKGIDNLKKGHSLVIFPEGTRSKGGKVGEFKAGSFKLATKAQVPIVPVTIDGTYKILEENNKITPAEIRIIIHEPISTKGMSREQMNELPDKVRNIIIDGFK